MAKPKITIWRSGKFSVPGIIPDSQCGKLGQTEFNFRVEITVDSLDKSGFVCDNFAVPAAFANKFAKGRWQASCEQLAGGGIYLMHRLCGGRALKVVCEISPINEAGVRVEWNKGDDMPGFFPRKVNEVEEALGAWDRIRSAV